MSYVSIYVAVIAALAAILGASVTPLTTAAINGREARGKRQDKHMKEVRSESVKLLRTAWDLWAMTQNNHEYHGTEMADRLAKVRERAANAGVCSAEIRLLAPGLVAGAATDLANAAKRLAEATVANTDLDRGVSKQAPNLTELDSRIDMFIEATTAYFGASS
jgi:hypothetical protein